jgi:4-hydroxy-2-oxoheptanedioate aldolase
MKPNVLRQKLESGEPTVSTHIHSTWPSVVEAVGHTGIYDYVEFVAEYGPSDLHDLDNLARAAELYGMGMMIKVDQSHQAYLAQRAVGSGFGSVLFTDARSADDIREQILTIKPDTPEDKGWYGVATRRHTYMGYGGSQTYVDALRDTVVAAMIEKKGAVDEIDEILELPGLDMVQWGGSDFSVSIGKAGQRTDPDVVAAHDRVFKSAVKAGVAARAEIQSADEAKKYLDMGVKHFSIGTDITILHGWWQSNGEALWRAISGE